MRRAALALLCAVLLLLPQLASGRSVHVEITEEDEDDTSSVTEAPKDSIPKSTVDTTEVTPAAEEPRKPKADIFIQARDLFEVDNDLKGALPLFEEAALAGNDDAMVLLGRIYQTSKVIERNATKAVELFIKSASMGNPDAMSELAFLYATGRGLNQSTPAALIYNTFAAEADDVEALRVLGNRYLHGLGVVRNCEIALVAYERAARFVVEDMEYTGVAYAERDFLIGQETPPDSAADGGSPSDIIEFYRYHAETGEASAQNFMGTMHLEGWKVYPVEPSDALAYDYFRQASSATPDALAHLGYMHFKGRHVEQDNKTAVEYFKLAAARGSAVGMVHLGLMYLKGIAVTQDLAQAHRYFKSASDQARGSAEAITQMGLMFLYGWGMKADYAKAFAYFQSAKKAQHVAATYYFGRMHELGLGPTRRSCPTATALYKKAAESGPQPSLLADAHDAYEEGEYEEALLQFERLAVMGFEIAQSNTAYIYDRILSKDAERNETDMKLQAMKYYELAAEQRRSAAYLRIGDYHYYGYAGLPKDLTKAVHFYQTANELGSAQAAWNLGYMYQWGEGLTRDLHLAKRYYDASAERSPDAAMPALLARVGLCLHITYDWLTSEKTITSGDSAGSSPASGSSSSTAPPPPTLSPSTAELLKPPRARIAGVQWDTFLITFFTGLLGLLLWLRLRRQ